MKTYYVSVRYDNGDTNRFAISSETKQNVVYKIVNNDSNWIKCDETGRHFNMSKVRHFKVKEAI